MCRMCDLRATASREHQQYARGLGNTQFGGNHAVSQALRLHRKCNELTELACVEMHTFVLFFVCLFVSPFCLHMFSWGGDDERRPTKTVRASFRNIALRLGKVYPPGIALHRSAFARCDRRGAFKACGGQRRGGHDKAGSSVRCAQKSGRSVGRHWGWHNMRAPQRGIITPIAGISTHSHSHSCTVM